ncbi:MAG: ABC transporter permease, partial [Vicinamibacterales bacterium]
MNTTFQEIRHAFRMLARSPGFTSVAALSLALGIGVNAAIFSLHDALLWRPLPVRDPGSVVTLNADTPQDRSFFGGRFSYANYRDLRAGSRSFDGLVAYERATVSFARSRQAARDMRMGMLVSDNFFDVLDIRPMLGRRLTQQEGQVPGRDAVVVLGYDFWRNTLGEDRSIVGGEAIINGITFTVVGVAPESLTGMDVYIRPAFYVPIMMSERLNARAGQGGGDAAPVSRLEDRTARAFAVKGRLKSGVSQQTAQAEATTLWNGLVQQYPDANRNRTMLVRSELQERIRAEPANATLVIMMTGLVALVLIIACANVANLLLAR